MLRPPLPLATSGVVLAVAQEHVGDRGRSVRVRARPLVGAGAGEPERDLRRDERPRLGAVCRSRDPGRVAPHRMDGAVPGPENDDRGPVLMAADEVVELLADRLRCVLVPERKLRRHDHGRGGGLHRAEARSRDVSVADAEACAPLPVDDRLRLLRARHAERVLERLAVRAARVEVEPLLAVGRGRVDVPLAVGHRVELVRRVPVGSRQVRVGRVEVTAVPGLAERADVGDAVVNDDAGAVVLHRRRVVERDLHPGHLRRRGAVLARAKRRLPPDLAPDRLRKRHAVVARVVGARARLLPVRRILVRHVERRRGAVGEGEVRGHARRVDDHLLVLEVAEIEDPRGDVAALDVPGDHAIGEHVVGAGVVAVRDDEIRGVVGIVVVVEHDAHVEVIEIR